MRRGVKYISWKNKFDIFTKQMIREKKTEIEKIQIKK
jgi:hypothetical protein